MILLYFFTFGLKKLYLYPNNTTKHLKIECYAIITNFTGNNITLSGTLGQKVYKTASTQVSLSASFGGWYYPYTYA